TIGWTLARWRIPEVRVEGRAASDEPADLARAREEAVAEGLARSGVSATGDAALRDAASGALERERGRAALRTATVIAGA
ncbi:MAG: hypothetical protein ACK4MT_04205, partial [Thermaurantiacus tibetensis]